MSDIDWAEEIYGHERRGEDTTRFKRVVLVALFLLLAVWAVTLDHFDLVLGNREPWLWMTTALVSVGPEFASIVIGVVTLDYLSERRLNDQLKAQLTRQLGMSTRDVSVPAARELAFHGWLFDGSLEGADLRAADLKGAILTAADLTRAWLTEANLSDAALWGANLREADLTGANLSETKLGSANLTNSELTCANFTGAFLAGANLSGAHVGESNFSQATLTLANLAGVRAWTIDQLEQAATLAGALMPDKVRIQQTEAAAGELVEGPTFEDWKAHYIAKEGGAITDVRHER